MAGDAVSATTLWFEASKRLVITASGLQDPAARLTTAADAEQASRQLGLVLSELGPALRSVMRLVLDVQDICSNLIWCWVWGQPVTHPTTSERCWFQWQWPARR